MPIGGILFAEKCKDIFGPGDHGTTYGGNPVACAGAIEVMKRITPEFLDAVAKKGKYLKEAILQMNKAKTVTGMGMMLGIELDGLDAKETAATCIEKGLLVLTAGKKIRLLPPLTISYEELDRGIAILKEVLA